MRKLIASVLVCLCLILFSTACIPVQAATTFTDDTDELNCYRLQYPVTVDGAVTDHEWSDAEYMRWWYEPISDHKDAYIYVHAKWDGANYLYVLVDLCPDNSSEDEDYSMLYFDENHNHKFSWGTPVNWEHYTDVSRDEYYDDVMSYRASPLGGEVDGTPICDFGFGVTDKVTWSHTIVEYKLALTFLNESDTIGFLVTGYGTLSPNYFSSPTCGPANYTTNATVDDWTDLNLLDIYKPHVGLIDIEDRNDILNLILWAGSIAIIMTALTIVYSTLSRKR